MKRTPGLRKVALTAHLTFSAGWIGAVIAYIGVVVAAQTSQDVQTLRAAQIALEMIARYVLVPLAFASLLTGLVMALGTTWGLFRHWWVLISFVLTIFAIVVLLAQLEPIGAAAAAGTRSTDFRGGLFGQLLHPVGGLVVLLVIQALNVYKPRGLTRYGWRRLHEHRTSSSP